MRPQDRLSAYRGAETFAPRVDLLPPEQASLWPQLAEIPLDLGAAKVGAIVGRAEARDYLDLFALLEHGIDLPTLLGAAATTHGPQLNLMLTLKALAYFADGDLPSLPEAVRARLATEATAVREIPSVRPASASILGGLLG